MNTDDLRPVKLRCPSCTSIYEERLAQPERTYGEVESTCLKCRLSYTIHLDNFVDDPFAQISPDEIRRTISEHQNLNWNFILKTLRLNREVPDTQPTAHFMFLDLRTQRSLDFNEFVERVHRNREIKSYFYNCLQDISR